MNKAEQAAALEVVQAAQAAGSGELHHAAVAHLPPLPADAMVIIPLRALVLFPGMVLPISVGRDSSIAAARVALRDGAEIGLLLQHDAEIDLPQPHQLHGVGTAASILRYVQSDDGNHYMVCQGQQRFRALEFLDGYPFHVARVQRIEDEEEQCAGIEARLLHLKQRTAEIIELLPQAPLELVNATDGVTSAATLTDFVAGLVDFPLQQKQDLLETDELQLRLDKVLAYLGERIEVLRLAQQINVQTRERIDDRQREYLLREQLKTIREELGEIDADDEDGEVERLATALERAALPAHAATHARKELQRLARMQESSPEYGMLTGWLEWMCELPWAPAPREEIDIAAARRILDEEHFGLHKAKRRILEYLAVRKLNPDGKSPILCFAGPPGVGKTSLGASIARATGRRFARVSLGGVHDEAEVRGHRRTYVGALPGNILQALRRAGSRHCVLMLDEIDKLGAGMQGDPAAALLEVLDPEQNASFRDHYLGTSFDLSGVLFICTANVLDTIPGPLQDRMEVLQLPGYTEEEKLQIAHRYLVERQREASGLQAGQCTLGEDALRAVIRDYTREAGVRNVEREIGNVFRHAAMRIAEGETGALHVDARGLPAILGPRKFENELAMRTSLPGVATGLAWTPSGGDILFIEASRMPGSGELILTGQLGEVMKESARAALTLVKAHCAELHVDAGIFDRHDIHVHVPAGAMPKDGPSAGVAIYVALASLVRGRTVRSDCAMTGEISLRGLVLPVGGVKEKVLAALQAGIRVLLLPARNRKDLDEIPAQALQSLEFVWLDTVDDALSAAIGSLVLDGGS